MSPATPSRTLLGAEGLQPVSPRLIRARLITHLITDAVLLALTIGAVLLALRLDWPWPWFLGAGLVLLALRVPGLVLIPRRVRALGYRTEEDVLITAGGRMFREVTMTPYGRIQTAEISEGPIERRLGICSVSFSTASASVDGDIPGLPREEAERLRTLLTERGIARMQSL